VSTTSAPTRTTTPVPAARAEARAVTPHDDAELAFGVMVASCGLVLGLLALVFQPLLMGAAGITLGLAGKHAGTGLGQVAVAVAMVGTVLGPTFGSVVYALLVGG
jgi:hypothetical protein